MARFRGCASTGGLDLKGTMVNGFSEGRVTLIDRQGKYKPLYKLRGRELVRVVLAQDFTALKQELDDQRPRRQQTLREDFPWVPGEMKTIGRINTMVDLVEPCGDRSWMKELREIWERNRKELGARTAGLAEETEAMAETSGLREYLVVSRGVAMLAVLEDLPCVECLLVPARPSKNGDQMNYKALMPAKYLRETEEVK